VTDGVCKERRGGGGYAQRLASIRRAGVEPADSHCKGAADWVRFPCRNPSRMLAGMATAPRDAERRVLAEFEQLPVPADAFLRAPLPARPGGTDRDRDFARRSGLRASPQTAVGRASRRPSGACRLWGPSAVQHLLGSC